MHLGQAGDPALQDKSERNQTVRQRCPGPGRAPRGDTERGQAEREGGQADTQREHTGTAWGWHRVPRELQKAQDGCQVIGEAGAGIPCPEPCSKASRECSSSADSEERWGGSHQTKFAHRAQLCLARHTVPHQSKAIPS